MCPSCGNTKSNDRAKKCSKCAKITCSKCSFTGCTCGSMSVSESYTIGK